MINENLTLNFEETSILKNVINKRMIKIIYDSSTDFLSDFVWNLWFEFEDDCILIERKDIIAKFFNLVEDGGIHKISKKNHPESDYTKNINRILKDIFIVSNTFEFEKYKISYSRAIIFNFDDCNLLVEKQWLFSLAGFFVRLEPIDAENFNLSNETEFWYDPDDTESYEGVPKVTQTVYSLKQNKNISVKHGLNL